MSKLGNLKKSYGNRLNIAISSISGDLLLSGKRLPANTLILNSRINDKKEDIEVTGIFITDYEGNAVRLTYTIEPGNGLNTAHDKVFISTDDTLCVNNNGALSVNLKQLVDNDTLIVTDDNKLKLNTSSIDFASKTKGGVVTLDNLTLKNNEDNVLYVDTINLEYATNFSLGIAKPDTTGKTTMFLEDYSLAVDTSKLTMSTVDKHGICKVDNNTINAKNGILSANINNFDKANSSKYDVAKIDNNTIKLNSNNCIYVDTSCLPKATSLTKGIVKVDNNTISIVDGIASVKDHKQMLDKIKTYNTTLNKLKTKFEKLNNDITDLSNQNDYGIRFVGFCNNTSTILNPLETTMNNNDIRIRISVITTCDFYIFVNISNGEGESPIVKSIMYDDKNDNTQPYVETTKYPSTNNEPKDISIHVICKNYEKLNTDEATSITKVHIKIQNANGNGNDFRELEYSIVRNNILLTKNKNVVGSVYGSSEYTAVVGSSSIISTTDNTLK